MNVCVSSSTIFSIDTIYIYKLGISLLDYTISGNCKAED